MGDPVSILWNRRAAQPNLVQRPDLQTYEQQQCRSEGWGLGVVCYTATDTRHSGGMEKTLDWYMA